jgi:glycosyltransferase involved in cell wall biosynthesis
MWQEHHSKASGYGRIIEYLDGKVIDHVPEWTFTRRAVAKIFRPIYKRSGSVWYHRNSFIAELEAARYWFRAQGQLFHFLYGEQCFRYFGYLKRLGRRNTIVCTYHTPPEKFKQMVGKTAHMRYIDAIIVLSNMQLEFFSKIIGHERVFYVPRSVDTEYFIPALNRQKSREPFHCLFVGHFLRDFDSLIKAAKVLSTTARSIRFTVITRECYRSKFNGLYNIEFLSGVSDERLLELYQTSDALVLPLLDATANNVVVEAMACGLPIISSDIPGVKDYVTSECAILTPRSDANALVDAILGLSSDRELWARMALAGRKRALDFSIAQTAWRTKQVYEHVIAKSLTKL